jgi:hypothetical protein
MGGENNKRHQLAEYVVVALFVLCFVWWPGGVDNVIQSCVENTAVSGTRVLWWIGSGGIGNTVGRCP